MKTLKHISLVIVAITAIFIGSCKKEPLNPTTNTNTTIANRGSSQANYCGNVTVTDLIAGQSTNAGQIIVSNNGTTLNVTYKTTEAWLLSEMDLYVGDLRLLPVTESGNPNIKEFPYSKKTISETQEYTFSIPLALVNNCFSVAAHAVLVNRHISIRSQIIQGWGNGSFINASDENAGMYFSACKQKCGGDEI